MPRPDHAKDFPPHVLREYALLADGERGALLGPRGDVAWLCAPSWDSDAVFCTLIGGAGCYAVTPSARFVWGGYYEEGSLIWRSRWSTTRGIIECREALAYPGRADVVVLLRRVVALETDVQVKVLLDPRAGYGEHEMRDLSSQDGIWSGSCGPLRLRWSGGQLARRRASGGLALRLDLAAGEHHDLILELSPHGLPAAPPDPDVAWAATAHAWSQIVPDLTESVAPRDSRHAYAVLRGLTTSGGGMVAAATMSLPERAEQGRNYDYRYVWIRDQAFTGQSIATAGAYPLLDDAVAFVSARLLEDGPDLAPAYTVHGARLPDQNPLGLPGYPGGRAIAGNHVNDQFQLDAFGESLLLLAAAAGRDHLDSNGWCAAEAAFQAIVRRWTRPDAGIWELDGHNWTESRLICVAGLRAIAAVRGSTNRSADWLGLAERIFAETEAASVHPSGRWQRAPDDDRVDAALLLPALRGAVPAGDPRSQSTVAALLGELADDHYLYRFRQQPGPLADAEGAFVLCGFLMAMAQHQQGHPVEAFRWFERNRAACGPAGLFAEEYDVVQRQLRGNLPQAFVHALMFEASIRLAAPAGEFAKG